MSFDTIQDRQSELESFLAEHLPSKSKPAPLNGKKPVEGDKFEEEIKKAIIGTSPDADDQVRIDCPNQNCDGSQKDTLSVHVTKGVYYCFRCGLKGNYLKVNGAGKKPLAAFLYEQANPATDHPYIKAKQIQPQDSRVDSHTNLVVPFTDQAGQIQTVQFINQAGKKRFLSKAKNNGQGVKGAAYRIDGTTDTAYVCEGAATGHSIHEATGCTVYCVGGKENFRHVVPWVKTKHQTVVVAADNDKSGDGLKAARKAAQENNLKVACPTTTGHDFNDMAIEEGPNAVKAELENPVDPGPGGGKPSFNLESFSLSGMTKQMQQQMLDDVPILGRVALLGQLTIWFAKYNAGKTLLLLYLLIQSIRNGILKGEDVFYCNADDSYKGLVCKNELAEKYGFHQLAPGQGPDRENTFKSEKLIEYIQAMIDSGSVHGKVIILDTYKKFTDPMSKGKSKDFFSKLREFAMCGGSVVMLAHVNKHRDDDKKVVYEGVADGVNDPDCAYTLDIVSEDLDGTRTVRFDNFKSRGDVATEVSYSYDCTGSLTYHDRLDSVKIVGEEDLKAAEEQRKARKELAKQRPIIDAITACIEEGITTKKALVKEAAIRCEKSQAKVTNVLRKRTGSDHSKGQMWFTEPGQKNTIHFQLNDKAPCPSGGTCFDEN